MDDEVDMVNAPPHYRKHPSGVECIEIAEHFGFNLGCVLKYIWRCDEKGSAIENLEKARYYINREIERRHEENPAVYCLRCGVPHAPDWECLRDNKTRRETLGDYQPWTFRHTPDGPAYTISDVNRIVNERWEKRTPEWTVQVSDDVQKRWRAMQKEHAQATARLADTIAKVAQAIDELLDQNAS